MSVHATLPLITMSSMSRTTTTDGDQNPVSSATQYLEGSPTSVVVMSMLDKSGSGPSVDMVGLGHPLAPKRANKACCACRYAFCPRSLLPSQPHLHQLLPSPLRRRDKIKCNGARPCSGRIPRLAQSRPSLPPRTPGTCSGKCPLPLFRRSAMPNVAIPFL